MVCQGQKSVSGPARVFYHGSGPEERLQSGRWSWRMRKQMADRRKNVAAGHTLGCRYTATACCLCVGRAALFFWRALMLAFQEGIEWNRNFRPEDWCQGGALLCPGWWGYGAAVDAWMSNWRIRTREKRCWKWRKWSWQGWGLTERHVHQGL